MREHNIEKDEYTCEKCPGIIFTYRCINKHFASGSNKEQFQNDPKYKIFFEKFGKSKEKKVIKIDLKHETVSDKKGYLKFLDLCCSLELSIREMSILAQGLKRLYEQDGLKFLLKNDFNEAYISSDINQITEFIDDLHIHFISPQRTAKQFRIQMELGLQKMGLCHYIKVRWLSLGLSLQRVIEIWESLKKYMEEKPSKSRGKKFDYLKFSKLFKDPVFKLKILFLEGVIKRLNSCNISYQAQNMEIQNLPLEFTCCVRELLELFLIGSKIPKDLSTLTVLPWDSGESQGQCIKNDADFIKSLELELHKEFKALQDLGNSKKKEFLAFALNYLKELVRLLVKYLPLADKTIQTFDFVNFPRDKEDLKQKVIAFNSLFKVCDNEQALVKEINELYKKNTD